MRFVLCLLLVVATLVISGSSSPDSAATRRQITRAVVLGGGDPTGYAWEIGLLKGLREAGIDLNQAELIVGTSAGAVAGSQVRAGLSLDELYARQLAPPSSPSGIDPRVDLQYFQATSRMWQGRPTSLADRIAVGQRALAASQVVPAEEQIQRWARILGVGDWPEGALQITAVDVDDGSTLLIDKTLGVPIERAVAASGALPGFAAPIAIGDRRYMDGAVAGAHVGAAVGYDVVVAVTPVGSPAIDRDVAVLRAQGSQVVPVAPDPESAAARGPDSRDLTRLRGSVEAGRRQAADVAAALYSVWNGMMPNP